MSQLELKNQELDLLEPSKAQMIKNTFEPMVTMLESFEDKYNLIVEESTYGITKDICDRAKRLRLDISKVRTGTEKLRKEQKEEYLRAGKAIDGVSNILQWAVKSKEEKLESIEKYFENLEKERIEKITNERTEILAPFLLQGEYIPGNIGTMELDVFEAYLSAKIKAFNDYLEAERIAEEKRKEEENRLAIEREQLRLENERLRKEVEESDRLRRIEEEKINAEKRAIFQQQQEIERQKEQVRLALQKAEEEKQRKIQEELSKNDSQKLEDLVSDLLAIKDKYVFESSHNIKKYESVGILIEKVIAYIKS